MNLSVLKSAAAGVVGKTSLLLQKNSPTIMLGAGLVGIGTATVILCIQGRKAEAIIRETKEDLEKIQKAHEEHSEHYSDEEYYKDLVSAYVETIIKFAKIYGPAIALEIISVALIVKGHGVLSKRNAALAAAYELVSESFKEYRKRVTAEMGESADHKFRFGEFRKDDELPPWEPEETAASEKTVVLPPGNLYSFVFSKETSTQFKQSYELNEYFLSCQELYANDRFRAREHMFLNEVLDLLGMKRTVPGTVVGWVKGGGDDAVDFGWKHPINARKHPSIDQAWILDFNCDGLIYKKI